MQLFLASTMIRVRLKFDSSPESYARKCWFVFDSEKCRLVGDVAHLIASHFKLKNSRGIQVRSIITSHSGLQWIAHFQWQLYIEDYLIPINESVQVIRDNDIIQ